MPSTKINKIISYEKNFSSNISPINKTLNLILFLIYFLMGKHLLYKI